jgi:hypothetical protein
VALKVEAVEAEEVADGIDEFGQGPGILTWNAANTRGRVANRVGETSKIECTGGAV